MNSDSCSRHRAYSVPSWQVRVHFAAVLIVVLTSRMRDQQYLVFPGYCALLARMIQNLFNSEKTFLTVPGLDNSLFGGFLKNQVAGY
jgi:hypothetical protein